jgi:DNA-binding HxlR family transcriptional regulator
VHAGVVLLLVMLPPASRRHEPVPGKYFDPGSGPILSCKLHLSQGFRSETLELAKRILIVVERNSDLLAETLELLGERWTLLFLRDMWIRGPRRFGQLQRNLLIARNVLSGRLAKLVAAGVVDRRLYQSRPERYEYELSETGAELVPTLLNRLAWGDRHLAGEAGPPTLFRHRHHDHFAEPVTICRHCGGELSPGSVHPLPGPQDQP